MPPAPSLPFRLAAALMAWLLPIPRRRPAAAPAPVVGVVRDMPEPPVPSVGLVPAPIPALPLAPEPAVAPSPVVEAAAVHAHPAPLAGGADAPAPVGDAESPRRAPSPLGRRVLDALRDEAPMRKAQIARAVEVGRGSGVRIVDQLVASGWLREIEPGRFALAA